MINMRRFRWLFIVGNKIIVKNIAENEILKI